jgi:two-component system alkaline phosphatase synthesis response regulator PhoP
VTHRDILVVDDSRLIHALARLALEAAGWSVSTVDSGREALESAEASAPDAILLDVVMPDMDGPATLARLQAGETTCDVPVILVTARDSDEDRARFEQLGAAGVIPKPFAVPTLAGQVAGLLGWEG